MADWFHSPEVEEIDIPVYPGEVGETIRARASDDVQVHQVRILIATEDDTLGEQGLWYTYTTTADCPPGPAKVIVTGLDLPGHEGIAEETLTAHNKQSRIKRVGQVGNLLLCSATKPHWAEPLYLAVWRRNVLF